VAIRKKFRLCKQLHVYQELAHKTHLEGHKNMVLSAPVDILWYNTLSPPLFSYSISHSLLTGSKLKVISSVKEKKYVLWNITKETAHDNA
jgi:hypothetical protein